MGTVTVTRLRGELLAALSEWERHRDAGRDLAAYACQRRVEAYAAAITALTLSTPTTDDMALARAVGVTPTHLEAR